MRVTTKTTHIGECFLTWVFFDRRPIDAMQTQVRPTAKQVRKFKQTVCLRAAYVKREVEKHIALHKPGTPEDAARAMKGLFAQMDNPLRYRHLLAGANVRVQLRGRAHRIDVKFDAAASI